MRKFYKDTSRYSREELIEFLANHERRLAMKGSNIKTYGNCLSCAVTDEPKQKRKQVTGLLRSSLFEDRMHEIIMRFN